MSYYTGYEHGRTLDDYLDYYNYNTTSGYDATSPTSSGSSAGGSYSTKIDTSVLRCLHEGCEYQTKHQYDLDRHQGTHFPSVPNKRFDRPGVLCCLYEGCEYQTKRQYDLDRHLGTHFPSVPSEKFDCPGRGCGRHGEYGFDRKDNLREHLKKVHAKDLPKSSRQGGGSKH